MLEQTGSTARLELNYSSSESDDGCKYYKIQDTNWLGVLKQASSGYLWLQSQQKRYSSPLDQEICT